MATMSNNSGLQLKTCPYDRCHKVKASRYQIHLTQCAKQYAIKGVTLRECPFNTEHRIPADQFEQHCLNCESGFGYIRDHFHNTTVPKAEAKKETDFWLSEAKDEWSEQYEEVDNNGYDMFKEKALTGQELFDQTFGDNNCNDLKTDLMAIQILSPKERKIYQNLCVQRIKAINEKKESMPKDPKDQNQSVKGNEELDTNANKIIKEKMVSDAKKQRLAEEVGIRKPMTNPFANAKKKVGISSTSELGSRNMGLIGIGIGRGMTSNWNRKSNNN